MPLGRTGRQLEPARALSPTVRQAGKSHQTLGVPKTQSVGEASTFLPTPPHGLQVTELRQQEPKGETDHLG